MVTSKILKKRGKKGRKGTTPCFLPVSCRFLHFNSVFLHAHYHTGQVRVLPFLVSGHTGKLEISLVCIPVCDDFEIIVWGKCFYQIITVSVFRIYSEVIYSWEKLIHTTYLYFWAEVGNKGIIRMHSLQQYSIIHYRLWSIIDWAKIFSRYSYTCISQFWRPSENVSCRNRIFYFLFMNFRLFHQVCGRTLNRPHL